jgi:2-dehydropantoate 2-reductase
LLPLVARGAAIYTFQNGIDSAERIGRIVGISNVVPGVGRILSHICEPGVIKQTGAFARLEFAESDNGPSPRTAAFHAACKGAGFEAVLSADIQRELWMKFAMLAPNAAVTALARGPISLMRDNPRSRQLLVSLVEEAVAVGMALKTGLEPADTGKIIKLIDELPKPMMASMAHDIVAGKPIEVDGLSGVLVRLGAQTGTPTPAHKFIVQALAPFIAGRPTS